MYLQSAHYHTETSAHYHTESSIASPNFRRSNYKRYDGDQVDWDKRPMTARATETKRTLIAVAFGVGLEPLNLKSQP